MSQRLRIAGSHFPRRHWDCTTPFDGVRRRLRLIRTAPAPDLASAIVMMRG
jgi:hypothetical protein